MGQDLEEHGAWKGKICKMKDIHKDTEWRPQAKAASLLPTQGHTHTHIHMETQFQS